MVYIWIPHESHTLPFFRSNTQDPDEVRREILGRWREIQAPVSIATRGEACSQLILEDVRPLSTDGIAIWFIIGKHNGQRTSGISVIAEVDPCGLTRIVFETGSEQTAGSVEENSASDIRRYIAKDVSAKLRMLFSPGYADASAWGRDLFMVSDSDNRDSTIRGLTASMMSVSEDNLEHLEELIDSYTGSRSPEWADRLKTSESEGSKVDAMVGAFRAANSYMETYSEQEAMVYAQERRLSQVLGAVHNFLLLYRDSDIGSIDRIERYERRFDLLIGAMQRKAVRDSGLYDRTATRASVELQYDSRAQTRTMTRLTWSVNVLTIVTVYATVASLLIDIGAPHPLVLSLIPISVVAASMTIPGLSIPSMKARFRRNRACH